VGDVDFTVHEIDRFISKLQIPIIKIDKLV